MSLPPLPDDIDMQADGEPVDLAGKHLMYAIAAATLGLLIAIHLYMIFFH
jgi:hypothetical protein